MKKQKPTQKKLLVLFLVLFCIVFIEMYTIDKFILPITGKGYDPVIEQVSVASICGNHRCESNENAYNCPADCEVSVFLTPTFDLYLTDSVLGTAVDEIEIRTVPDKFEPLSLVVFSNKELTTVKITANDLVNPKNTILKENIDIRVVKLWEQSGKDSRKEKEESDCEEDSCETPELLLYNDEDVLRGGFNPELIFGGGHVGNSLKFSESGLYYKSENNINIEKGNIEFWFKIPADVPNTPYKEFFRIDDTSGGRLAIGIHRTTNGDEKLTAGYFKGSEFEGCAGKVVDIIPEITREKWYKVIFAWDIQTKDVSLSVLDEYDELIEITECTSNFPSSLEASKFFVIGKKDNIPKL